MPDFHISHEDDYLVARRTSDNAWLGATSKPRHKRDLAAAVRQIERETTQQLDRWRGAAGELGLYAGPRGRLSHARDHPLPAASAGIRPLPLLPCLLSSPPPPCARHGCAAPWPPSPSGYCNSAKLHPLCLPSKYYEPTCRKSKNTGRKAVVES